MYSKLLECRHEQVYKILSSQQSVPLEQSHPLMKDLPLLPDYPQQLVLVYLHSLKALHKDFHKRLQYVKRHFGNQHSALILQYKFIKYEYLLSGQLEDDYLFQYYTDVSHFIQQFKTTKRSIKAIVKAKGQYYQLRPNKFNKIFNFFKAIDL